MVCTSCGGNIISSCATDDGTCEQCGRDYFAAPRRTFISLGTRSLLFGVHQIFLHPFFVALAWIKLYGFPFHPLIWLSFVVHDWGYWGKTEMDGPSGDLHPYVGARIMGVFGRKWYLFALCHSRFLAKQLNLEPSRLCMADKYAFCMYPMWLYLLLARTSGEVWEYMQGKNGRTQCWTSPSAWHKEVFEFIENYVAQMKHGGPDTITTISEARNQK